MSIPRGSEGKHENKTDFCSKLNNSLPVQKINPEMYKRCVNGNGTEVKNKTNKYFNTINKHHWSNSTRKTQRSCLVIHS